MRLFVAKVFAACALMLSVSAAHSACALSSATHPQGVVGLQLFYPDDPRSWLWADDLGVTWLRIELRHDWIEPFPGQFDASYADRVFALAAFHPQRIMLLFNHAAAWMLQEPELFPARAAAAMAWIVARYGARIDAYEIYNEINLSGYGWTNVWGTPQDSAAAYAKTLAAVSGAIRERDKTAFVISSGLSPSGDPETYARHIVRLTPPNCYDALGLHFYGQQGRFAAVLNNAATLFKEEKRPNKPIWNTEFGTTENAQRASLLASLAVEKSLLPISFFFTERDFGIFTDSYGLRNKDGSAKPDYELFKRLMR